MLVYSIRIGHPEDASGKIRHYSISVIVIPKLWKG
jgi:hypothetical protein